MKKSVGLTLMLLCPVFCGCGRINGKYVITKNPTQTSRGIVTTYYSDGSTSQDLIPCLTDTNFYTFIYRVDPTCIKNGSEVYNCKYGLVKNELIDQDAHDLVQIGKVDPTVDKEGYYLYEWNRCHAKKAKEIEKLKAKYYISIYDSESKAIIKKQGVDDTGHYNLGTISRRGYDFLNYSDESGNDFPSSGVISSDRKIYAKYSKQESIVVSTFQELKSAVEQEKPNILINNDIEISETLFFTDETFISSNGNYTLKRNESFDGDLFVIGCDSNFVPSMTYNKHPYLNIGYGMDTSNSLTIDGNKTNVTVDVKGSAISAIYSSKLNIYNNVNITNNKKVDNSISYIKEFGLAHPTEVGGAAILNISSEVNLYNGLISNNEVNNDETKVTDKKSTQGGAIYNYGSLNIYNCVINDNIASRGGAIYNYRTINIHKGSFENNHSIMYGSCIYSADSQHCLVNIGDDNTTLGDIVFNNNLSDKSGGCLFGLKMPMYLINKTVFTNNTVTSGNGGAINSAGVLTVKNSLFENNSCSSKGGAIYSYYNDDTGQTSPRYTSVDNCEFINNKAKYGGAISNLSENEAKYIHLDITNSQFSSNNATSGGALYTNGFSITSVSSSSFNSNMAVQNGGAIYSYGQATLNIGIKDDETSTVVFDSNTCGSSKYFGGALYLSNGGSYISQDPTVHKISNFYYVNALNNTSYKGGFLYATCVEGKYNDTYVYEGIANDNVAKSTDPKNGSCMFVNNKNCSLHIPGYGTSKCKFEHNGLIDLTDGEIITDE